MYIQKSKLRIAETEGGIKKLLRKSRMTKNDKAELKKLVRIKSGLQQRINSKIT